MYSSMKRILAAILFLSAFCPAQARTEEDTWDASGFSYGLKIGFAATGTNLSGASVDGMEMEDYRQDTQLGNLGILQLGYGMNKFYLKSGAGISLNKSTFFFDGDGELFPAGSEISCSYKLHNILVPFQFGYNVIDQEPYRMSIYAGPDLRFILTDRYRFDIAEQNGISFMEEAAKMTAGITLGLNVLIGRTFFDVEYERVLTDISKGISLEGADASGHRLDLGRHMGIFSFSYGILF